MGKERAAVNSTLGKLARGVEQTNNDVAERHRHACQLLQMNSHTADYLYRLYVQVVQINWVFKLQGIATYIRTTMQALDSASNDVPTYLPV